MSDLYDISPVISSSLKVFPGDTPPVREVLMDMERGDPITLSTLRSTVHLGAHVDGPNHYGRGARPIDEQPLDLYLGPCQVVHVHASRGARIRMADVKPEITEQRVLFYTGTFADPTVWSDDFAALDPDLVDDLHARGVRLVGVDTPSVDPAGAKVLEAHHRFLANDMAILEGVVLNDVPEGRYELIALPLKLRGFDGSPVRAVLRSL